ncbi:GapA-binding peptide SR1P [Domibacillus aminovorans]|uniref:GapA-binding peptide SR1P n=1 Tax=Domibacillus aminovorans TaxID=29332 RepID=UPI0009E5C78D
MIKNRKQKGWGIMSNYVAKGSIICKNCGELIDTMPTEKVTVYYSDCKQESCENSQSLEE